MDEQFVVVNQQCFLTDCLFRSRGPAFGYPGPTDVLVYLDGLYNSFMFAFPNEPPVSSGLLSNALGEPLVHKLVTLNVGVARLNTYTDGKGEYRFYGATRRRGKNFRRGKRVRGSRRKRCPEGDFPSRLELGSWP